MPSRYNAYNLVVKVIGREAETSRPVYWNVKELLTNQEKGYWV